MNETEVVQVNYWREIRKEINKTIDNIQGLVLLTHNSVEFTDIIDFLNKVRKKEKKTILYISLVNSYSNIMKQLEIKPLDSIKFFVVDCVSNFIIDHEDTIDCTYSNPPNNLEGMKELILENIRASQPNIIVIDSLSQFINFSIPTDEELQNLYSFLKLLRKDALGITNDTIILLYDDRMGPMKKLPALFIDIIIKLEVIREKIKWRD